MGCSNSKSTSTRNINEVSQQPVDSTPSAIVQEPASTQEIVLKNASEKLLQECSTLEEQLNRLKQNEKDLTVNIANLQEIAERQPQIIGQMNLLIIQLNYKIELAEKVNVFLVETSQEELPSQDYVEQFAFMKAVAENAKEIVDGLLNCDVDINAQNDEGNSALHLAAMNNLPEMVTHLLQHNVNTSLKNKDGNSVFHLAVHKNLSDVFEILLSYKGENLKNLDVQDNNGNTALHLMACAGQVDSCSLLVAQGADVNVKNQSGNTALDEVIRQKEKGFVARLGDSTSLSKNTDISSLDDIIDILEDAQERGLYGCWVMPKETFMQQTHLLTHEEAKEQNLLVKLTKNTPRHEVIFVSHRWYRKKHPDDTQDTKCKGILRLISNAALRPAKYVWLDLHSIPQDPKKEIFKHAAIKSLPFYARKCGEFVLLVGHCGVQNDSIGDDEASLAVYESRGWCRLERFAAASPVVDLNGAALPPTNIKKYDIQRDDLANFPFDLIEEGKINPLEGEFVDPDTDKKMLAPVIVELCEYVEKHCGYEKIKERSMIIRQSASKLV